LPAVREALLEYNAVRLPRLRVDPHIDELSEQADPFVVETAVQVFERYLIHDCASCAVGTL
jgi:hypothetical protein